MTSAVEQYAQSQGYTRRGGYWYSQDNPLTGYSNQGLSQMMGAAKIADSLASVSSLGQDYASQRLQSMMTGNFSPDDPSYNWRFQQGQQALERSQAAKGLLGSGNAATELVAFGQGLASTEYADQYRRLMGASQLATQQYDSAISSLMKMLGVGVQQDELGLQSSKFSYSKQMNSDQERGIADALQQMMYQQAPQAETAWGATSPVSAPAYISPTYSSNLWSGGYQEYGAIQTNLPTNMGSGQGYITSSSGNTTTFGGYSGSTDYWGN